MRSVIFAALAGIILPAIMPEAILSPLVVICCIVIIVGTVLSATPDWGELFRKSRLALSKQTKRPVAVELRVFV